MRLFLAAALLIGGAAAQTVQLGTSSDPCIGGTPWASPQLRFGDFSCTIPAPTGVLSVRLDFQEPSAYVPGSAATGRLFNVFVNDAPVLWNVDLFSAGANASGVVISRAATVINMNSGTNAASFITVRVATVKRSGVLSAIIVTPLANAVFVCDSTLIDCQWRTDNRIQISTGPALLTKAQQQAGQTDLCIDTGTVSALACAPAQPYNGFSRGMIVKLIPSNTNTGPAKLALSGLSAHAIKRADGSDLKGGELQKDRLTLIWDDGSDFRLLFDPAAAAASSASVQQCQGGTCAGIARIATPTGVYLGVKMSDTLPDCANPPGSTPCWLPAR